ncbi:TM0996/MTH895 family glutaredoxin-like protein [Enterococcus sp. MJM12]|jgi:small redox-active disulfide protein 2|uniref:Thioredoxin family protein n=2 Tax=Enterococcus TaxID=1350 RepID=A0AAW8U2U4_9ENTE|nr:MULTISPECIES: thioredoxin family protein [Enterococcus]MBO0448648.1 TM0996/MTH895 family glutaredoxin-like protein [Enterococcus sp. MJM12]MDT2811059.1 thioredoxin family protein [Enterococcus asini]
MEIKIVGPGCKNCQKLKENVETAANDLGITPSITKVEDMAEIVKSGVMKTPGLIIDDKLVVSGRVAKPKEIKQLLQEK